jgi:tRNA/tmRNA/rRNA uracil-C5-methylase (TrmA/RlmC/RlmD family)
MQIERSNNHPPELRTRTSGTMTRPARSTTTGWQPTCECESETIPCTVLDPFAGSGTTGVVCSRFGREFIGIELNPEYAEMARKRIGNAPMSLFA